MDVPYHDNYMVNFGGILIQLDDVFRAVEF